MATRKISKDEIGEIKSKYEKNYYSVNRPLIKLIGYQAAFFFDVLIKHSQLINRWLPYDWFYYTGDRLFENTGLSKKQQARLFSSLERSNLIKTKKKGMPARKYVKINYAYLEELLDAYNTTVKESELEIEKDNNIYDYDNDTILNLPGYE